MVNLVKELFQVHIYYPSVTFFDIFFCFPHRIMTTSIWPKTITMCGNIGSYIFDNTWAIACCIKRSVTAGIPSNRTPPSGFGISTLRTGFVRASHPHHGFLYSFLLALMLESILPWQDLIQKHCYSSFRE